MTIQSKQAIPTISRLALAAALLATAALTGCNADGSSAEPFRPVLNSSFNGEAISNLGASYAMPSASHHAPRLHASYTPAPHRAF